MFPQVLRSLSIATKWTVWVRVSNILSPDFCTAGLARHFLLLGFDSHSKYQVSGSTVWLT